MVTEEYKDKSVILFDGICNLCNRWVQFVLRHDKQDYFRFAPLQSPTGKEIVSSYSFKTPNSSEKDYTTILLIENECLYTQSTAVLKIFKKLSGLWSFFSILILIPKSIRDAIYRFVSRNRYLLFGKRKSCMLPSDKWEEKFIAIN